MSLEIKVLGAGVASHGYLDGKEPNTYSPGFYISWGNGSHLMLECGAGVAYRLEKIGIEFASVQHIAVSHPHPDHYAPIHFFQSVYCKGIWSNEKYKNEQVCLYGPEQIVAGDFEKLWKLHLPEFAAGSYYPYPKVHRKVLGAGTAESIGNATLVGYPVYHAFGRCPAIALRLETPDGILAYSGDTNDCEGVRKAAQQADIFICEASSRIDEDERARTYGHLTPAMAGRIAHECGVKRLIIFHYTGLDKTGAMRREIRSTGYKGDLQFAKDFKKYTIDAKK